MLVQGSNLPILLTFDEDASTFQDLSVKVYPRESTSDNPILSWGINDIEKFDEYEVHCPIAQSDLLPPNLTITADLNVAIEVKWLGENDTVYNIATAYDYISHRRDTTILGN